MEVPVVETILLQEINVSCFPAKKYLVEVVEAMDRTVRQLKQMQRSSTSISRTLQQHLQAGTLTVQTTSGGGSAARTTAAAAVSALSTRAAPTLATRATVLASLPRSAFTNP